MPVMLKKGPDYFGYIYMIEVQYISENVDQNQTHSPSRKNNNTNLLHKSGYHFLRRTASMDVLRK